MHTLHIKIDPTIAHELKETAKKMDMSVSKFVRYMFKQTEDCMENHLCTGEEETSTWKECNGTTDLYLRIEEKDYRKVKNLHSCLNSYSMAQIVRALILSFLAFLKKLGRKKLEEHFVWFQKKWKERLRRAQGEIIRQHMWRQAETYTLTFSESFTLLRVKIKNQEKIPLLPRMIFS